MEAVVSSRESTSSLVTTGFDVGSGKTPGRTTLASPGSIVSVGSNGTTGSADISPAPTPAAGMVSMKAVVGIPCSSSPTE